MQKQKAPCLLFQVDLKQEWRRCICGSTERPHVLTVSNTAQHLKQQRHQTSRQRAPGHAGFVSGHCSQKRKSLFLDTDPPPPTFPPSSRGVGTVLRIQQISAQWIFEMSGHLLCLCVEELNFYTARHIPEPGHMYYSSRNVYKGPAHLTLSTFCKHMY